MTPYRHVVNGQVQMDDVRYLTADEETDYYISEANIKLDDDNHIVENEVIVRYNGDNLMVSKDKVDFVDVSPSQVVSLQPVVFHS